MANAVKGVFCLLMMITVLSLDETDAFPTGPPVSLGHLCTDMIPQHGRTPQTSPPPYTITASSTCYTPGQVLTVNLLANASTTYRGFFLQARKPDDNTMSYGTFDVSGITTAKALNCFQQTGNAVGHNSRSDESDTTFQWMPPTDLTGEVRFVATVVQDFSTYWIAAVERTIGPCAQ